MVSLKVNLFVRQITTVMNMPSRVPGRALRKAEEKRNCDERESRLFGQAIDLAED
jgi:hypothetical protein